MDKQWKRSLCLLAVLLVTALTVIPVRAATTSGSLRITLTDRQGRPAGAVTMNLYRVAGTDGALTEDFSGADIPAASLLSEQDAASNARTLADWASAHSLAGTEAVTDSQGKASFSSLDLGIYLAVCRTDQSVTFAPFLISIPLWENGWPIYDVTLIPRRNAPPLRTVRTGLTSRSSPIRRMCLLIRTRRKIRIPPIPQSSPPCPRPVRTHFPFMLC